MERSPLVESLYLGSCLLNKHCAVMRWGGCPTVEPNDDHIMTKCFFPQRRREKNSHANKLRQKVQSKK